MFSSWIPSFLKRTSSNAHPYEPLKEMPTKEDEVPKPTAEMKHEYPTEPCLDDEIVVISAPPPEEKIPVPPKPSTHSLIIPYKDSRLAGLNALIDPEDETLAEPFQIVHLPYEHCNHTETSTEELTPDELNLTPYEWIDNEIREEYALIKKTKAEKSAMVGKNDYPETEEEWHIPDLLKKSRYWKYETMPSEYTAICGYYFNAKYPQWASNILLTACAATFAGPNIYFAFTAPLTKGTMSLAYLASQTPGALTLGTLCASASAYVNISLLRGTIPLAIAGSKDWVKSFDSHPLRASAIGVLAVTGASAQAFLASEAFRWASSGVKVYMVGSNFFGFLFIRSYGANNAAKRWDKDFAPLSLSEKIDALFQWKNLLAFPPTLVSAIVFGQKFDGALNGISNDSWSEQSLAIRAPINLLGAITNPILYFGQVQQVPATLETSYRVIQLNSKTNPSAWISLPLNFMANGFAAFGGLSIAHSAVRDPHFFLENAISESSKEVIKYTFVISVNLVNTRLFFDSKYKMPTPKPTFSFDVNESDPPLGCIKPIHNNQVEMKPVHRNFFSNPHFLFTNKKILPLLNKKNERHFCP